MASFIYIMLLICSLDHEVNVIGILIKELVKFRKLLESNQNLRLIHYIYQLSFSLIASLEN